jgi:hypothetical protein
MGNTTEIESRNFGLSPSSNSKSEKRRNSDYDNWFWESKSKKKMKENLKAAEVERMRAETAAMQQIFAEQDNSEENGIGVGKIALIGGLVVLLGIGVVVMIKKKGGTPNVENSLSTNEIIA